MTRIPLLLFVLAACAGGKDTDDDPVDTDVAGDTDTDTDADSDTDTDTDTDADAITDLACTPNATTGAVLDCTWTTPAAGTAHLEVTRDSETWSTPTTAEGTSHSAPLVGLKAGETYAVTALADVGGEALQSEPLDVATVKPAWLPSPIVTGTPTHPYTLTSIVMANDSFPSILDADGDFVWWYEPEPGRLIMSTQLGTDGASVVFLSLQYAQNADEGKIIRVALDGSSTTETRSLLAHHDFAQLANGDFAWIGYTYGTYPPDEWVTDAIHTTSEGSSTETPAEVFNMFDAYPVPPFVADPGADNFALGDADFEWSHGNSLMITDEQHYYLMSKFLDCILKIDLAGNIVWQMGGQYSDFTNPGGSPVWLALDDHTLWSHAHMSHFWEGGLVVFDNGYYRNDGTERSRVVEYSYDESLMEITEVWSYEEPDAKFTTLMGDARKLANGNVLIGWSSLRYISEVTTAGDVVWRLEFPGGVPTRVTPVDNIR